MDIIQVQQFKRGSLEMIILSMINEKERYGREIINTLNETGRFFSGARDGAVYPVLYRLKEKGFIDSKTVRVKKREREYYYITEKGQKELYEVKTFWSDYVACVNSFME